MLDRVDACGLACPQPVINASKALETNDSIIVIVDNQTALENIKRLAKSKERSVSCEMKSDGIYIVLEKKMAIETDLENNHEGIRNHASRDERVLVISQEVMGRGDNALAVILMKSFFHTIAETVPAPDAIILFNSGVKLLVDGSEVLEDIRLLEKRGLRILACGTCLDYFKLKDRLRAGHVSNMYEIKELMLTAS
ncbi:MAG TPA: sulfurtransferase-like selenium metabolism protein YedF [Spirochaetota bacterium]|nr:sulfurtransferase-like selenium metabolism protein YedF [Spirochaetota bacterium]HPC42753.1 sulfurtransferase-like selenium metabolism protein YedF [Spirochaetota bacterium]HPL17391.1 sulfurtransferase-like selenium metabolism protein YedF [Spirochaetota bacterium]HQJ69517.1 sulfurtransferase-like selenium metabolism protein YedF [Spirochaetota bacterium]HRS75617.1 sulfurtransferase-like selenium metabolism protein YedF [Spirochaetota bacterium]